MAKTIRLLSTYNGYKPGDIITVDDAIAAQLLPFNATENLTGGTPAYQPSPGTGLSSGTNLPPTQTLNAGQTTTMVVPAGAAVAMQASSDVSGNYQVLNPDSTVASTTPLASGLVTTGVFLRDTSVRFAVNFGSLTVQATVTGGSFDLLAGENQVDDWLGTESAAVEPGGTVLPGAIDQVLGSMALPGQYLKRGNAVVTGADSRVVRKEGNPSPKKTLTTHASTASTTTVLNTAVNPDSVLADQYRGHMVRVGTGPYRKILTHPAFAANAVNAYTLDQALPAAPGTGVAIAIEDPNRVVEVLGLNAAGGPHPLLTERRSRGDGWRYSTGLDVMCDPIGKFTGV